MSSEFRRLATGLALIAFIATYLGCGPKNVPLPSNYYSGPEKRVAVVVIQPPMGSMLKAGNQGLLDMAINNAASSDLTGRMLELAGDNVMLYFASEWMEPALDGKGVDASVGSSAITKDTLPAFDDGDDQSFGRLDARQIASATGADAVLLLDLSQWGVIRSYYGFIPTGPPSAHARMMGLLLDGNDNSVVWRYLVVEGSDISGKWNQPTRYSNIVESVGANLASAFNVLMADLGLGTGTVDTKEITELLDAPAGSYTAQAPAVTKNHEDTEEDAGKQHDVAQAAAEPTETKEAAPTLDDSSRGQAIALYLSRCAVGNDETRRSLAEAQYDQLINVLGYSEEDILPLAEKLPEDCEFMSFKIAITSMARD